MSAEDPTHKSRRYSKLFLVCAEVIPLLSWMLTQSFRSSKGRGGPLSQDSLATSCFWGGGAVTWLLSFFWDSRVFCGNHMLTCTLDSRKGEPLGPCLLSKYNTYGISLIQMHRTRCASTFGFFPILEYLHRHNELSWGWDPSLNTKFNYVLYTPNIHSLLVMYAVF